MWWGLKRWAGHPTPHAPVPVTTFQGRVSGEVDSEPSAPHSVGMGPLSMGAWELRAAQSLEVAPPAFSKSWRGQGDPENVVQGPLFCFCQIQG